MKISIQSVNFNMDKDLKTHIEDKINTLHKFHDRIVDAEVFLKVQQTSDKENKTIEVKINVPGESVLVKKTTKTFEEGISVSIDALKRSLRKIKEKQRNH